MKKLLTISALCFGFAALNAQTPATKPAPANKPATTTTATKPAPANKPAATTTTTTATKPATTDPGYKFDKTTYDYGTMKKGGEPNCVFRLTNTSKEMLVITEAHGSCGCTVPTYSKEPIKPGQTIEITVHYDTNRIGPFEKQVTVTFQGKDTPAVLHIKGTVEAPPQETTFPGPGSTPANGGTPVNN
ncbi:MAG: DUF1573 domain-containing protein [Bacteroidota bacterium]|nr:DUF1573 domain-containing protein [Bacteroidota bacterium]